MAVGRRLLCCVRGDGDKADCGMSRVLREDEVVQGQCGKYLLMCAMEVELQHTSLGLLHTHTPDSGFAGVCASAWQYIR